MPENKIATRVSDGDESILRLKGRYRFISNCKFVRSGFLQLPAN